MKNAGGNTMIRIADGVYVEPRFKEGNVGLIEADGSLILVDLPVRSRDLSFWMQQVAEVGHHKPIAYIINTDHHPLRIMPNALVEYPKIASRAAWEELASPRASYRQLFKDTYKRYYGKEAPDSLAPFMPTLAFAKRMTLHRDGRQIRLVALGGATAASLVVHLPKERVLFVGALAVNGTHPNLALALSSRWLEALTYLRRLAVDVIVPGYGEPGGKEILDANSEYIRRVRSLVRRLCDAGKSRSDVSRLVGEVLPLMPVPAPLREEIKGAIKAGLGRIYDELKAGEES